MTRQNVGHYYTQIYIKKYNETLALLQITGGKDESNIVVKRK